MKRNLIISALLALVILIIQLITGATTPVLVISVVLAFGIAMAVLAVSDKYGRRD